MYRISYSAVKNSQKVNKNFSSRSDSYGLEFASIPAKLPSNLLLLDWFHVNYFQKDRNSKKKNKNNTHYIDTLRIKIHKVHKYVTGF